MKINSKIFILYLLLNTNLVMANELDKESSNLSVELKEITAEHEVDDSHKLYDIEPIEDNENQNTIINKIRKRENDEIKDKLKKEHEIENFLTQDYKVKSVTTKDNFNFIDEAFNAAENGDLDSLKILISQNLVKINQLNKDKNNLLIIATVNNHTNIVKFLLAKKININAKEKAKGSTSLHLAYKYNYNDIAQLLVNNGANKRIRDEFGNYPDYYKNLNDQNLLVENGK